MGQRSDICLGLGEGGTRPCSHALCELQAPLQLQTDQPYLSASAFPFATGFLDNDDSLAVEVIIALQPLGVGLAGMIDAGLALKQGRRQHADVMPARSILEGKATDRPEPAPEA